MSKTQEPGAGLVDPFVAGLGLLGIPFWDCSEQPNTNDRLAKLGRSFHAARGVAIAGVDKKTNIPLAAYGFDGTAFSAGQMEPDNWVFLDHGGKDKVWAHRGISDHENGSWTIAERSDIVVNQKRKMCYGYRKDKDWVVEIEKIGAPVQKERAFNGAGFLPGLYGGTQKDGGFRAKGKSGASFTYPVPQAHISKFKDVETGTKKPIRAVVANNIAQNGGYLTDGLEVGQFHQLFGLMPVPEAPPGPQFHDVETGSKSAYRPAGGQTGSAYRPAGGQTGSAYRPGGETVAGRENKPRNETVAGTMQQGSEPIRKSGGKDSDCMVKVRMAALRGNVWFDVAGKASHLAIEDSSPARADDPYYGHLWPGPPAPRGPQYVPAEDQSNDQPRLPTPEAPYGLRPVVYIPRATGMPPTCEVQPHFDTVTPTYSTAGVLPPAHTGGSADAGEWVPPSVVVGKAGAVYDFKAGKLTAVFDSVVIPSTYTDMRFFVEVPYQIPVAIGGGDQMDFRLFYKVVSGPGQLAGDNWTEVTKMLGPGDNPLNADQVKKMVFEIPPVRLGVNGGGGRIHYRFMRRSDDSSAETFRVVGNLQHSYAPASSRATPRRRTA